MAKSGNLCNKKKKKEEEKVMKLTMRPFKFDEANNGQHNRNETF